MSSPLHGVGTALSELAGLLLSTGSVEDMLQGIVELSVRTIAPSSTGSITLERDGRVLTVAASGPVADELDEHQYEARTGPCLEALATGEMVAVPDFTEERRWNGYPAVCVEHGIRSSLSTPMAVGGTTIAVLNLYGSEPHAFTDTERQLAVLLAGHAATALTAALRHYEQVTLTEHLHSALSSRAVIDQAIGVVIAQQRCSADEAFATLRGISQRRNVKLRVVATELVEAMQRAPVRGAQRRERPPS